MPAAYAHLTFGRRVLDALPGGALKDLIQKRTDLFEIGLLGPDILFFYQPLRHHPVNRIGHELHDKSGTFFLDREVCKQATEEQLAYLLGFICHYALDSECHTLVEYYMEKIGREHSTIETDLERFLMVRDGLDCFRHAATSCIRNTTANTAAIAPFYGIRSGDVGLSLISMKLIGRLLTPSSALKHKLLSRAGAMMGERSIVTQLTMDRDPDPVYSESNHAIAQRIESSIPVAIALMDNFFAWHQNKDALSQRFRPNFSYDPEELARLKERDTRV